MQIDEALDTLEVLVVGDRLKSDDVEAIQVVRDEVLVGQAVGAAMFALKEVRGDAKD